MLTETRFDGTSETLGGPPEEAEDLDARLAELAARIRAGELDPSELPPDVLAAARGVISERLANLPPIDWAAVDWERLALGVAAGLKVWAKGRRRRR